MNNKKRRISSIVEILIGVALIVASIFGAVDEYWTGMGTSLLLVGVLFFIRTIKYNTNDEYREKLDIEVSDERNRYLKLKSWAWAGYLFIISVAVASIGFKIAGREDLMMMASWSVCYIIILYWISNVFLRRKY